MLKTNIITITPDQDTAVLVGPEGLVWTQPAIGEPVILAARNEAERAAAAQHIGELLGMGLVPYGLPLDQSVRVAMFGGPVTRGCVWVPASEAPAPEGGDPLPTAYAVFTPPEPQRTERADDLITISEAAALLAGAQALGLAQALPMQALLVEKVKHRGADGRNATVSIARCHDTLKQTGNQ